MFNLLNLFSRQKTEHENTRELLQKMSKAILDIDTEIDLIKRKPPLTNEEKKEKGNRYEAACSQYFSELGYSVIERGATLGKRDGGVDLIAFNDQELLMIQCKDWNGSHQISSKEIRAFYGDCFGVTEEYNDIGERSIRRLFVTSRDIFDYSAKSYIEEHPGRIEHLILEWV